MAHTARNAHRGYSVRERLVVHPAQWQGERNCVVGPFPSRQIAASFATYVLDFGDGGVSSGAIFSEGNRWFVEVESYSPTRTIGGYRGLA